MADTNDQDLQTAVAEFVGAFEEVFGRDWNYSQNMLHPVNLPYFVKPDATFIEPGVEDEIEDWGARGALLEKYRQLVRVMHSRGIQPKPPSSVPDPTGCEPAEPAAGHPECGAK